VNKLLLAIDVGNTHTTVAVFRGQEVEESWSFSSDTQHSADELWLQVASSLSASGIDSRRIARAGISSVVPALTERYHQALARRLKVDPLVITKDHVPGIRIDYHPPEAVGADRLCSAVAGFQRFGGPLIVIDLGTATVFDVIRADGTYEGGLIAPGLDTAVDSLHSMTAVLPRVVLTFPDSVVGKSTAESIQAGVLYGAIEMIDGIVNRLREHLGEQTRVVATGGFSTLLKSRSRTIERVEPNLVLEGIRLIVEGQ